MIRVLIVDDEARARKRIHRLAGEAGDLEIVGESADGRDAQAKIGELQPDLVFLDIRMPGMSGLELGRTLQGERSPYIIFTTAHSEFAIEAFKLDACDYLLKPVDDQRFREALKRVRSRLQGSRVERSEAVVQQLLATVGSLTDSLQGGARRQRIGVKSGTRIKLLDPAEVAYVKSDGDYLRIFKADGSHEMVRDKILNFMDRIGGAQFVRISRSVAVNLDYVVELKSHKRGDYQFTMKAGERFVSGPTYRPSLRALLTRFI